MTTIIHIEDALVLSLGIVNIILIILLMKTYGKNYLAYRSKFALGLLLFTIFLLAQAIIILITFFYYTEFINTTYYATTSILISFVLELMALTVLLMATSK